MELNYYQKRLWTHNLNIVLRKMKTTIILLLLCVGSTFASSYSQSTLLTLNMEKQTIKEVIDHIEEQSEYVFFFSDDIKKDLNQRVDINTDSQTIDVILNNILNNTELDFTVNDRQVAIIKKAAESSPIIMQDQSKTISGIVYDENNEPLIGVSVVIKGTTTGISTDIEGRFNIKTTHSNPILLITYIGYKPQEINVGNKQEFKIVLVPEDFGLDEVVVVGYGVQKKVNLTGAVSQVTSETLENRPTNSVSQMLQGTMPNVRVSVGSGAPGQGASIRVRGTGSIVSNTDTSPLILVDGVPGNIDWINPADIESISVLKDASSAAIYGARAAFGVVLVTTKSGGDKEGKARISYNGFLSWSKNTTSTDFLTNGYEYLSINDTSFERRNGRTYTGYSAKDMEEVYARRNDKTEHPDRPWVVIGPNEKGGDDIYHYYGNYDWWNFFFKEFAPAQSHSVSVTGGNDKVKYVVSAGYYSKDGLLRKNTQNHTQFTINTKISAKLTPWLTLTNNIYYYDRKYTYPGMEGETDEPFQNINYHALPVYAPINPDGTNTYTTTKNSYSMTDGRHTNLLSDVSKGKKGIHNLKEHFALNFDFMEGLTAQVDYTFQFRMSDDWYRRGKEYYSIVPGKLQEVANFNTDYYKKTIWYDPQHIFNAFATFERTFNGKHNISATAGINYENMKHHRVMGQKYDLVSETLNDLNLGTGDALATGDQYEYELFGAFMRVNYNFDQRYLFEFNGRYDGTSRYRPGDRYGFFPSFSGAWRLSEEAFFEPARNLFDNVKLRLSYGSLGNQVSGNNYYPYIATMTTSYSNYLVNNDKTYTVAMPAPIATNLTWERVEQANIGLDLNMFNNRLSFTGDFYTRSTKDMLIDGITLPAVFGASSPKQNSGDLRTDGWELSITWNDQFKLANRPFHYGLSFGIADSWTEVTKYLANDGGLINTYYKGKKVGEIWGYRVAGLFQSDQEAADYTSKVDQSYVNTQIRASQAGWNVARAGDVKFIDIDGNGKIHPGASTLEDHGDLEVIGNTMPRYEYSFGGNASWNGFDFSIFFQGIMKQDFYPGPNMSMFWGPYSRPYMSFIPEDFGKDIWSEDNKSAYFPQHRAYAALNSNGQLNVKNDRYLQNIGYLRLKNLAIGYTLPSQITKKVKINNLRIYLSGENLAVWSPFKRADYIDPEVAASKDNGWVYPLSKTFSVGLNITF